MTLLKLFNKYAQQNDIETIEYLEIYDIATETSDVMYFSDNEKIDEYEMKSIVEYYSDYDFYQFIADERFTHFALDADYAVYSQSNLLDLIDDYAVEYDTLNTFLEQYDVAYVDDMFHVIHS